MGPRSLNCISWLVLMLKLNTNRNEVKRVPCNVKIWYASLDYIYMHEKVQIYGNI